MRWGVTSVERIEEWVGRLPFDWRILRKPFRKNKLAAVVGSRYCRADEHAGEFENGGFFRAFLPLKKSD